MKRKPIASGQVADCRPKPSGRPLRCRSIRRFAGAICGNGPVQHSSRTRNSRQMRIANIQHRGSARISRCAVLRSRRRNDFEHRVIAIFISQSATIYLSGFVPAHCEARASAQHKKTLQQSDCRRVFYFKQESELINGRRMNGVLRRCHQCAGLC